MKIWQLFENFSLSELNANFAELLASINGTKATYLTANKTVYVATTGSDTTGDGTSANPYRTIAKGLSMIPKNLNGFDATLNVASGTYAETVTINGFTGGTIYVTIGGSVSVNRIIISKTQHCYINSGSTNTITTTDTTNIGMTITQNSFMQSYLVNFSINSGATTSGIFVTFGSNILIVGTVTINNALYAFRVSQSSRGYIATLAGTGNTNGLYGTDSGILSYNTKTISATTDHTLTGGSIITNLITMS